MRILQVILIFSFLSGAVAHAEDRYIVPGNGAAKERAGNGSSDCVETMTPEIVERLVTKAKPDADRAALSSCQQIGGTAVARVDEFQIKKGCQFFGTIYTVDVSANYQCTRPGLPPAPGNFQERVLGACHDSIRSEDLILAVQTLTKSLDQRAATQCPGKSPIVSAYNTETGTQHCAGFGIQVLAQGNIAAQCSE